jgi:hypothetical protein
MATKNSLTRDEAREAIGILALKEDNLENAAIVTSGALLVTISIFVTVISIKYNLASDLIIIIVVLLVALIILLAFRFKCIDEKAKKLAKEHNLEEFYNAVLGKYK